MARRLASHLYQGTLRVWGEGCWEREAERPAIRRPASRIQRLRHDADEDEEVAVFASTTLLYLLDERKTANRPRHRAVSR